MKIYLMLLASIASSYAMNPKYSQLQESAIKKNPATDVQLQGIQLSKAIGEYCIEQETFIQTLKYNPSARPTNLAIEQHNSAVPPTELTITDLIFKSAAFKNNKRAGLIWLLNCGCTLV